MKIMITGSKGQLGNELINILRTGKSEIGSISEEYSGAAVIPVDIDDLDISDFPEVERFVLENRPDIIINCAAYTNVDGCESLPETAYRVNSESVKNLAVAAEKAGVKLVELSTDYVFGGNADKPYVESDAVDPQGVYAKSKALGEKYAAEYCKKTFIVRTAWLYGYVGKNFVKTVRRVLKEKGSMTVVNDQRGNPTNANDLAYHILKLCLTEEYGIYHCTGEGECSWYEFASEIAALSGYEGKVYPCTTEWYNKTYNVPAKRPYYSSLSNSAVSRTVGNEMRDWKSALKEYISKVED